MAPTCRSSPCMSVVEGSAIDGKFGQCKTFAIEKWEDEDACVEVGRNSGGCFISSTVLAAEVKVTVLYSQPKSAEEFDKYYFGKHMPMVYAVKEIEKVEIARPGP